MFMARAFISDFFSFGYIRLKLLSDLNPIVLENIEWK